MDAQSVVIVVSIVGPVIGFLVGTLMQAILTKRTEEQGRIAELVARAFGDYIAGITQAKFAVQSENLSDQLRALSLQTDAKVRLCVYGSPRVVQALASLSRTSMILTETSARDALIEVCKAVRDETHKKKLAVEDGDIQVILFGKQT